MKISHIETLMIFFMIVMISGCSMSGRDPSDQTAPNPSQLSAPFEPLPVGVSEWSTDGIPVAGTGTFGIFSLQIDPASLSGELTPLRSSATTDVLEIVDITNFLQLAPCTNCARLHSISLNADDHIVLSIGIRHPFPVGDPFKPITGRNRADLHVFNVEGSIISDGVSRTQFPNLDAAIGGFRLVNADGYSGVLDSSWDGIFPTEATIHPYITHFDDYSAGNFSPSNIMGFESVTDPPPSGNLVMAMGCAEDIKNYELDIPLDNEINLAYAVGCTYALSAATMSQRFTPEYRVPQHNKKAASEISVDVVANNLLAGDPSSEATLHVSVVDINHGVPVGDALSEMKADSSVGTIEVDIPGLILSSVEIPAIPIGGTGHDPSNPLVFEGGIHNEASALEGKYNGLVKVTDTYPSGLNESPLLNGKDGIQRVDPLVNPLTALFDITEFVTYQAFTIDVMYSIPNDLVYNLKISTVRNATYAVTALRLDWDSQQNATDYHIYRKDAYDLASVFTLLDDGVSADNFFEDETVDTNEGYQYFIKAVYGVTEANESNLVFALLENGEDNVNTNTVWEVCNQCNGSKTMNIQEWGICTNKPANGAGAWNSHGVDFTGSNPPCFNWWTGTASLLCSPVIPIPPGSTVAYLEYNVLVDTLLPQFEESGGSVGVADAVNTDNYWPSNSYRSGWEYNFEHVEGLSQVFYYGKNYLNIDSSNDYGYAGQNGDIYYFGSYYLPDLLIMPDARAVLTWAASASTYHWGMNYDDVAVIVY